ncbi:V-type ATP synthase subunit D [Ignavigranum ruoffiae]|uniref:V-type ATP synthase subunit D n=1 Tax=Ignavigranum ruoffiae TaxID=89093 RepID=A0A1H8YYA6_9LACT|nr:V-type ATP synthase subunit D [Ignavigranum ruoffiae]UPQ85412.1 V-type ATP synthase subunit D [Ignavigranum ruoffiae]SEP57063.1 V/A-type H+-transporting ATPase subunit D [Ignavigranum ruoffiae]
MARLNVKPTRGELAKLKQRLKLASRGHKLLKDKQDELMRQFILLIRQNNEIRKQVEGQLLDVMQDFVLSKATQNQLAIDELFAIPAKSTQLIIEQENIMSVKVPKMFTDIHEEDRSGEIDYSFLTSNAGMDGAMAAIEESLDALLKLAETEKTCQLMADEIEKTRRRVNALEYRTIPELEETIYFIEMKLEEAERSALIRMMKVKDMR